MFILLCKKALKLFIKIRNSIQWRGDYKARELRFVRNDCWIDKSMTQSNATMATLPQKIMLIMNAVATITTLDELRNTQKKVNCGKNRA